MPPRRSPLLSHATPAAVAAAPAYRSQLAPGFAMESGGFASYAAALALAPLALVQSIGAGGIGVLA